MVAAVDQFSRKVGMTTTKDRKAKSITKAAARLVKSKFQNCKYIVTDNAKEFHSKEWEKFCKDYKINQRTTSPYSPQSNISERAMKEIGHIMRTYTYFDHSK